MAGQAASLDEGLVELSADEITAMQAPYDDDDDILPAKVVATKATEDPAPVKADKKVEAAAKKEPDKAVTEFESLRDRLRRSDELLAAERSRRIEAERIAHEHRAKAVVADVHVVENQYSAVANAIEKAKADDAAAQNKHAAALEVGDYKAATAASREMAAIAAKLAQLEDGKVALEDRVVSARETAKAMPKEAPKAEEIDPVERYVAQFGPKEQAWLRAHPECVTDEELNAKVLWADKKAKKTGVKAGSDEYFAMLDKEMGYAKDDDPASKADDDEPPVVVDTSAKPKPAPTKRVAAPVSRDTAISRTADGRYQVRLTREQMQMADDMGLSREAYAKQLVALKQAENNPNYSGPRLGVHS